MAEYRTTHREQHEAPTPSAEPVQNKILDDIDIALYARMAQRDRCLREARWMINQANVLRRQIIALNEQKDDMLHERVS